MNIQTITADWIMGGKNIKILDGIAGAAKTSRTVQVLQEAGISYMHTTSTNRLKRDIENRFQHEAKTVASALFKTTDDGGFYAEERETDADVIIIDEILQTDPRVFEWIQKHPDKKIIICTDSKQMLAPITGEKSLKMFQDLKDSGQADVLVLDYSYRPVNDDTRERYNAAYDSESEKTDLYNAIKSHANWIDRCELEYNDNDVYICHSNDIEADIYDRFDLRSAYDKELIPKGTLSNRDKLNTRKYPIMPQIEAIGKKGLGYLQLSNIGSTIRYQGSEVQPGRKLYFLISPHCSIPENREIYTMITRAKDFKSIVFCYYQVNHDIKLSMYNGKPIVPTGAVLIQKGDDKYDQTEYTNHDLYEIKKAAQEKRRDVFYNNVIKDGHYVISESDRADMQKKSATQTTIGSLLKKSPEIALAYPNLFYHQIEKYTDATPDTPNGYKQTLIDHDGREVYKYGVDLYASYPHCWYYGKMINGRTYTTAKNRECKIYVITGGVFFKPGTIITQPLYDYLMEHTIDLCKPQAQCIGSVDYLKNDQIGQYLITNAYKSVEDKKSLKNIHYGLMARAYIHEIRWEYGDPVSAYWIDKKALYELAYAHIQSIQAMTVAKMLVAVYNSYVGLFLGRVNADCAYFNTGEPIEDIGFRLEFEIPDFDFRIFDNLAEGTRTGDKPVLYQSYEPLKTKEELRREQKKECEKKRRQRLREQKIEKRKEKEGC